MTAPQIHSTAPIRATATDTYAPSAYLGRVVRTSLGCNAERTDWSDTTRDHGPDAEQRAVQAVLNSYEAWKLARLARPQVTTFAKALAAYARS